MQTLLSSDEYEARLAAQHGGCAICGGKPKKRRLSVDHDHVTGHIRGLLCHSCNLAIGLFRDDTTLLMFAVAYLNVERGDADLPAVYFIDDPIVERRRERTEWWAKRKQQ